MPKSVTILGFSCKQCGFYAAQFIAMLPDDRNKEDVLCPQCKSGEVAYDTMF